MLHHGCIGCILLKECTKDVEKITSSDDLRAVFPDSDWGAVADEFDQVWLPLGRQCRCSSC